MSINIWTDSMQHAALLGKPVLFTNWLIQRDIIPDGWYCYDLRGTHKSPSTRTTLVDHAADYHAGTVLSPIPLKHEGTASRRVNGTFYLLGEEMTLEQFCEEHDLAYPQDNREFVLRPASLDEVGLFYSEEKLDEALGTVGHLRMDFGHGEKEFWHTWWPHNEDRFNTPEFKEVLQRFVDDLRQTGLLKNLGAMDAYCWQHGGSITEDRRSYGYIAETENYRFCLRCTPFPGEYQGYLYCYDLCQQEMYRQEHPVVGRVTFASGEQQEFTDSKALLQAIREELPFRSTTGFRFETLTDDPEVKKAVDDILLDFAGEDNSRRTCNYGLTETGKQALMLLDMALRYHPDIICVGEMRSAEAYAAQEAARTGHGVLTTIHSNSSQATWRRMVTLCKRKHEMADDTLMDLVTEAFPIVVFAKQLEDKSRKIMEIMECEILPTGERRYNTLYHFKIEENRLEDGKYRIKGRHEAVNPISESLQKRFIDNGMPQEVLTQLVGKKSAPSKGKSGSSPAKAGQATPAPKTRSAQSKPPAKPETGKEGGESV